MILKTIINKDHRMITLQTQLENLIKSTSNPNKNIKNFRSLQSFSQTREIHLGVVGKKVEISDKAEKKRFSAMSRTKSNLTFSGTQSPSKPKQKSEPFSQLNCSKSLKSRGSIRITFFNPQSLKPAKPFGRSLIRMHSFHKIRRFCKDQSSLQDWTVEESYASNTPNFSLKSKSHFVVNVPGIKFN